MRSRLTALHPHSLGTDLTIGNRLREVITPLYSTLIRCYLEQYDQLWATQYQKDADKLEWGQQRATKMVRGQSMTEGTGINSVEMRKLCEGDLIPNFQYLGGGY